MIKWFVAHNLVLNFDKMNKMKFITKNSSHSTLHTGYKEMYIEQTVNAKFLGLQIDIRINWKNHIEQMTPKLSTVFHSARSMVHISNINILKSIYYAYFHSITKYGIIFWGHSSNGGKLCTLQKKFMGIMAGAQPRNSCRCLFKQSDILPVPCQYIVINELYYQ